MNIKYTLVNWTFDKDAWSKAIGQAIQAIELYDLAELLDIDHSTLVNWAAGRFTRGFTWPHMANLLKVCNLLDIDPRSFFILKED